MVPNKLSRWLFDPVCTDTGLLLLRVAFGTGIAYHGFGKVTGDITKFAAGVAELGFPLPLAFAWAAALSELLGGIFLAIGLLTRPAALFIVFTMAIAAFGAHGADPFKKKELALAYLFAAAAIFFTGAGRFAADYWLRGKSKDASPL
ncbi:MAG: DoxX family protein [Elusimicrobiota bacterium]|nr:DoxX family protein [Elusimicrobiota bacterium]